MQLVKTHWKAFIISKYNLKIAHIYIFHIWTTYAIQTEKYFYHPDIFFFELANIT